MSSARISVAGAAVLGLLAAASSVAAPVGAQAPTQTTVTGVVRTVAADTVDRDANSTHFGGRSEDVYRQVLFVGGKSYVLHGKQVRNNTRVEATGTISGNDFTATSITTMGSVAGIADTGTTRVLVMLAEWAGPDGVTRASATSQMFSDTNGWYRDASYGALGQTGDVTPWLHIAGPTTGCYADHLTMMDQAKTAATAAGYDVASYDNYVLYFPECFGDASLYAGWAYVGSTGTWLNGYMDRRVTVHEQGHNYGLWHSHSYMCSGGGLIGTCTFDDYGDLYDAMGSSGLVGHFNASQKTLLGWMNGRSVDLSAGGATTLVPLAADSTSPHAAFVSTSTGRTYWAEYRQRIDYDTSLPSSGTDGVLIHVAGPGSGSPDTGASLIDVRPSDGIAPSTATLRSGQSWVSPDGMRFSVGSVTSSGATLTVSLVGSGTRSEEMAPGVAYDSWVAGPDGTFRTSKTANATATYKFSGTNVTWVTRKGTAQGRASVTIDGVSKGIVDLYSATPQTFAQGYTGLAAKTHTLVVKVLGTKNASATGAWVAVDAFKVGTTTVDDTSWKVLYNKWNGVSSTAASGGTYRNTAIAGGTSVFMFSGTAVDWITAVGPGWGKAKVYIDGVDKGTVDLYATTQKWQTAKTYGGLTAGSHTIKVAPLGTKNAAATSTKVAVDAFVVR